MVKRRSGEWMSAGEAKKCDGCLSRGVAPAFRFESEGFGGTKLSEVGSQTHLSGRYRSFRSSPSCVTLLA